MHRLSPPSTRTIFHRSLPLALLLAPCVRASAQDTLYMPRAVKQAFARGTRLPDGRPGPSYWQNHARYAIDLTALPPDRSVRGSEQITYFNNSPDSLAELVIKLFMNVHEPGAPRNLGATEDYLTNGVQVESFAVNGAPMAWQQ